MAISLILPMAAVLLITAVMAPAQDDFADSMRQASEAVKQGQLQNAEAAYRGAVASEPLSAVALEGLANVVYESGVKDRFSGSSRFDEAKALLEKAISIDTNSFEAHEILARIIGAQCIPSLMQANLDAAVATRESGDLPYGAERQNLRTKIGGLLEEGFQQAQRALAINPNSPLAMHQLSALLVIRASVDETPEASQTDRQTAKEWLQKAASGTGTEQQGDPRFVRIGARIAEANLIGRVDPVYPPLARAARIQGTIEFTVMINEQGHVTDVKLVMGHPMLVNAAKDAVMQWVYRPTLLNGRPVKVMTTVKVPFRLAE